MRFLTHNALFILFVILTLFSIGCRGTQKAAGPTENYSQYRTYTFGQSAVTSSDNPIFAWPQLSERIQKALSFHLPSAGLDLSSENPDLRIYYYAIPDSSQMQPILDYRLGWKAEPFLANGESFREYGENTLVLDFVDTNQNELVWRGSIHLSFENENEAYRNLSKKIRQLVDRYPGLPPTSD